MYIHICAAYLCVYKTMLPTYINRNKQRHIHTHTHRERCLCLPRSLGQVPSGGGVGQVGAAQLTAAAKCINRK